MKKDRNIFFCHLVSNTQARGVEPDGDGGEMNFITLLLHQRRKQKNGDCNRICFWHHTTQHLNDALKLSAFSFQRLSNNFTCEILSLALHILNYEIHNEYHLNHTNGKLNPQTTFTTDIWIPNNVIIGYYPFSSSIWILDIRIIIAVWYAFQHTAYNESISMIIIIIMFLE